jgi:hypothetical protein
MHAEFCFDSLSVALCWSYHIVTEMGWRCRTFGFHDQKLNARDMTLARLWLKVTVLSDIRVWFLYSEDGGITFLWHVDVFLPDYKASHSSQSSSESCMHASFKHRQPPRNAIRKSVPDQSKWSDCFHVLWTSPNDKSWKLPGGAISVYKVWRRPLVNIMASSKSKQNSALSNPARVAVN